MTVAYYVGYLHVVVVLGNRRDANSVNTWTWVALKVCLGIGAPFCSCSWMVMQKIENVAERFMYNV
jgi:hypothetical protein